MALDICAASKSKLETFFGKEVFKTLIFYKITMKYIFSDWEKILEEIYAGKIDNTIWGCRHKRPDCNYKCTDFIDKNSKYISDKYEPINEMVN